MSYGYPDHLQRYGNGENEYRSSYGAQPKALKVGDVLMTGEKVTKPSRHGYNGRVLIYIDGIELEVPGRLPIAIRRTTGASK